MPTSPFPFPANSAAINSGALPSTAPDRLLPCPPSVPSSPRLVGRSECSAKRPLDPAGRLRTTPGRHRRRNHVRVVRFLGDALMEEIAARAPSLKSRLHRRRRDGEIVEAHRGLKRFELLGHYLPTLGKLLAPARDPNAEQKGNKERLQRGLHGHLAQSLGPDDGNILRGRLERIGTLLVLVLLVGQPGGFCHCRGFLHVHAPLLF